MQLIHVVHQTTYTFDQVVTLRPHRLLLRPRDGFDLRIRQSGLSITPTPALYWQRDAFNNSVAIAVFDQPTLQLDIVSTLTLEQYQTDGLNLSQLLPNPVLDHDLEPEAAVLQAYQTSRLALSDLPQSLTEGLSRACAAHEQLLALQALCADIKAVIAYQIRETPGVQTCLETLALGSGSCRDLAWLLIEVVRGCGLPARFVSGYLLSHQFEPIDGATHAWVEVYFTDYGWIGFDPTVGRPTGAQHIAVAMAPDPKYVPPVSGAYLSAPNTRVDLSVKVRVEAQPAV
ncbi:transglutaminase family protein [Pseudomonadales bacterium]|nr:transglutaminase family protein [Pseudomonadales bacterium]